MEASLHLPWKTVPLRLRHAACLLLVLSLLYNPFVPALDTGNHPDFCRPASHRATVGASELQHFSPANGWVFLSAQEFVEPVVSASIADLELGILPGLPVVSFVSPQFFGPGLWFRPPPAL